MTTAAVAVDSRTSSGVLRRGFGAVWRMFAAMALCQTLLGAVVVLGWTYRLMQRRVRRYWTQRVPGAKADGRLYWPEWAIAGREARAAGGTALVSPLWANLKTGAQALFTTWTLTLPACVLWQFGWFAGWDNSFNKGYEQAFTGAGIAWLGIAWFLLVMPYVPIAQARQAATGEWRRFFDFRVNRAILRRRRFSSLLLALGYALASFPIFVLTVGPYFVGNNNPAILELSRAEQLEWLKTFHFWGAAPLVALFVGLRLWASRIYAAGLVDWLRSGEASIPGLAEEERTALGEAEIVPAADAKASHRALWAFGRAIVIPVTVALWFTVAAQVFVGQFLHYRPVQGWLNQPLIQAPWIRNIPGPLQQAASGEQP